MFWPSLAVQFSSPFDPYNPQPIPHNQQPTPHTPHPIFYDPLQLENLLRHYPQALVPPCVQALSGELKHIAGLLQDGTRSRLPAYAPVTGQPHSTLSTYPYPTPSISPDQGDLSTFYFAVCVLRCMDCMSMDDDYREDGQDEPSKGGYNAVMTRLEKVELQGRGCLGAVVLSCCHAVVLFLSTPPFSSLLFSSHFSSLYLPPPLAFFFHRLLSPIILFVSPVLYVSYCSF